MPMSRPSTQMINSSLPNVQSTELQSSSGYNWSILCCSIIVVLTISGNILVCLAVRAQRKLRNMFNFFLVSLAVSDTLSAILVMPLSIIKAFIGDMPVPRSVCIGWYSLDVFFTSSTIIHLCMISIDRYMSFKYPLRYGRGRKTQHTVLKICLVWVISFCIAGPLFLFSMLDEQKNVNYKGCGPETATFVLSATITSFYLPLLIMSVMYILTVQALHHQRLAQRKLAVTSSSSSASANIQSSGSLKDGYPVITTTSCDDETPITRKKSNNSRANDNKDSYRLSPLLGYNVEIAGRRSISKQITNNSREDYKKSRSPLLGYSNHKRCVEDSPQFQNKGSFLSVDYHETKVHGMSPSSTSTDIALNDLEQSVEDGERRTRFKTFRFRRDAGSSRRQSPDKGRRAVQVLGILFAVFVICYLPFFATYTINGTCTECQQYISPHMIMAFEWLAYSGSMFNPIIYHIFNPDFRRAFHKLLRCRCNRV